VSAVLVIAGCDSSAGAGVARDLTTLADLATPALLAITAVTAQTDTTYLDSHPVPPEMLRAQIAAAFATRPVAAVKIGMLGNAATVVAVGAALAPYAAVPIVLDPVLMSSSGGVLLDEPGRAALHTALLHRVTLLTPNIPEAALLLGCPAAATAADLETQARQLLAFGPRAVLLKGGHGPGSDSIDVLAQAGTLQRLVMPRIAAQMRGSGCALSSAIAAYLAAGLALSAACARAKEYVSSLLQRSV
jgi:hydroxymethylpyrimidine/phosphomethylpyrimidine kinase